MGLDPEREREKAGVEYIPPCTCIVGLYPSPPPADEERGDDDRIPEGGGEDRIEVEEEACGFRGEEGIPPPLLGVDALPLLPPCTPCIASALADAMSVRKTRQKVLERYE